jgi:predicted ATPase
LLGGLFGDEGRSLFALGRYAARAELFASVADALTAATATVPAVLLLEDAHWADRSSLELLRFVSSVVPGVRTLLVVTARGEESGEGLTGLPSSVLRVPLGGLDAAATGELMVRVLGRPVTEELADDVRRRTGGNPFFVHEVARLRRRRHTLKPRPPGAGHPVRRRSAAAVRHR